MRRSKAVLDRLAARSVQVGECVVWTGAHSSGGYGQIKYRGRMVSVHRIAWIERHGPIPPETPWVLHRCDNPPCWRDEHLWLGTRADNIADMLAKGRQGHGGGRPFALKTHCPQDHPFDAENTYVDPSGYQQCRECRRRARQTFREKEKAK
jgi:hypothetical protein